MKNILLIVLLCLCIHSIKAQIQIIQPDSVESGDHFGRSVAIFDNTIIAGAPFSEFQNGEAFIFEFDGTSWNQVFKASNPEGSSAFNQFAQEVEIEENFAFIGHPFGDGGDGDVVILKKDNGVWSELGPISPGDALGEFGYAIDADSNKLIVGARTDNNFSPINSGSAYIYALINGLWTEETKIDASDAQEDDLFGSSVAIQGNLCIVGAPGEDSLGFGFEKGAAYIYDVSNQSHTQIAKLRASDGENGDQFGTSAVFSGNYVFIGAPGDDDISNDGGAIYVFENINGVWTEVQKLTFPGLGNDANLGLKISAHNGDILVNSNPYPGNTGKIYLIKKTGGSWNISFSYTPPQISAFDYYAFDIAMNDNHYVAGAWSRDIIGINSGQVFITDRNSISNIEEFNTSQEGLKIWPNPFKNTINLDLKEYQMPFELYMSDMHGIVVFSQIIDDVKSLKINLESLSSGVYIISIHTPNKIINSSRIFKY